MDGWSSLNWSIILTILGVVLPSQFCFLTLRRILNEVVSIRSERKKERNNTL